MFGKIKNKLKSVFQKHEDLLEEEYDEIIEEETKTVINESKSEIDSSIPIPPPSLKAKKTEKKIPEKAEEPEKTKIIKKTSKESVITKSSKPIEPPKPPKPIIQEKLIEEEIIKEKLKKKGLISKFFSKKDKEETQEIEKLEETMLDGSSENEKRAIKEHKELEKQEIEKNKKQLEKQINKEQELEEKTFEDIGDNSNKENKKSFFSKTITKLKSKKITYEDFEKIWIELEIFLLEINIAYEIVEKIEKKLKKELLDNSFNRFKLSEKIREVLEEKVQEVLIKRESNLIEEIKEIRKNGELVKILILGVNGTGKTTSIAKIVKLFQKNNLSLVVAASDTFRAAATEQLEEHSKKLNFKLIMHKGGSDPAAVAFDAIEHAKAKHLDIVLIDTAGRMPNNSNLMMELEKIKRISKSQISIFIGDSISGNDLIEQIDLFNKGIGISGIILTKVDTDEKPGSIVTTAYSIDKPIYYLGTGQNYDDLVKFNAKEISKQLFDPNDE